MLGWLSCKKFCEHASRNLDDDVAWEKKPGYIFHFLICVTCRRYLSQIKAIDEALCQCAQSKEQDIGLDPEEQHLSKESKGKISQALEDIASN